MHTVRIGISFDSHSIYAWHLFTSRIFARYSKVLIVASVSRSSWRLPVDTTLQTSQNNLPQALERMPSRSYVCFAKGKAMIVHICSRMNLLVKFPSWVPRCRACMRVPCFIIPAVPIRRFFKTGVGCLHDFSCFSFHCGLNQASRAGFEFATPQMCIGCQDAWEAGCQMVALNGQKSCLEAFRL